MLDKLKKSWLQSGKTKSICHTRGVGWVVGEKLGLGKKIGTEKYAVVVMTRQAGGRYQLSIQGKKRGAAR